MGRKYLVVLSLLVGMLAYSCSKDHEEEEEKLNQTGEAFMSLVMERENWEKEWQSIEKLGTPHPNKSRKEKEYYMLPVLAGKDRSYAIVYPIEETDNKNILGDPLRTHGTCTEKELYTIDFTLSVKDWEEEEPREGILTKD